MNHFVKCILFFNVAKGQRSTVQAFVRAFPSLKILLFAITVGGGYFYLLVDHIC